MKKRTKRVFRSFASRRLKTQQEMHRGVPLDYIQAEEALRKTSANLRAIFNHVEYALVLLDKSLIILSCNSIAVAWSELAFGSKMKEGDHIMSLLSGDIKLRSCDLLNNIITGNSYDNEIAYTLKDGSQEWYRVRMNPVLDQDIVVGLCISAANITPRKVAEIEKIKITNDLIQHNNDLEQFAYIVSHNIRAPVANLIGLAEELNLDYHPQDVKKLLKREIETSARRLDSILLDLNMILKAKREINEKKKPVDLTELVCSIQASIRNLIDKEQVTITTNFKQVNQVSTLRSYIHSIFFNLITNSIKYRMPDKPVLIEIKSAHVEGKVVIRFKDNGSGIDLDKKSDQVFGLYKRFHPHIEGKGIGLFMVKTQVNALGGKISIESEVNKGTQFTIEFPLF